MYLFVTPWTFAEFGHGIEHRTPVLNALCYYIQASAFVGGIFGGPIGGIVADRLGRKTSLILNSFPLVSGYFILLSTYLISNGVVFKVFLMVGRFLTGIGVGWALVSVSVSDCSEGGLWVCMPSQGHT